MLRNPDWKTARDLLLSAVTPVGTERIALSSSGGRVLAADLTAQSDIPPFDRSPYDGYAFRSADTAGAGPEHPITLTVTETIAAGQVPTRPVLPGTAARLMTGAPIPEGADAVCMFEKTVFTDTDVTLREAYGPGENVIRAGEDVRGGTVLARAGDVIDAGTAGTLASQDVPEPLVYRRPRVGLISTGDEVTEPGTPLGPGQIRNANRYTLETALARAGMEPVWLGLAGDDEARIASLIRAGAASCDAVVLTGGVSVGDRDLTPAAMEAAGCRILLRGVDMKPGMACAYGIAGDRLVCGLSGNPASSLTNFCVIALPALRRLAGHREPVQAEITVTLRDSFAKKSPSWRFLRGRLDLSDGTARMILPPDQGNVVLSSSIGCDVMAAVPAGSGKLAAGTTLKGFLL